MLRVERAAWKLRIFPDRVVRTAELSLGTAMVLHNLA